MKTLPWTLNAFVLSLALANVGVSQDKADDFDIQLNNPPIKRVVRKAGEDKVTVFYQSDEDVTAQRKADVTTTIGRCKARIEVFVAPVKSKSSDKGLNVGGSEKNSFGTQIVIIIRPVAREQEPEPTNWRAQQIHPNTDNPGVLMRINHAPAEGFGDVCIGPRPIGKKAALPRMDTKQKLEQKDFHEIEKGSNRWIMTDTPRLPAFNIPENGHAFAAPEEGGANKDRVRAHRDEVVKPTRRFATFFFADCAEDKGKGFFRVDWKQDITVTVKAKEADWTGSVPELAPGEVSVKTPTGDESNKDPELKKAEENGIYKFEDGYNREVKCPD